MLKTLGPLNVMLEFRVGYRDHVVGLKPLMSVVVIEETNRVERDAVLAWICPAEIVPEDIVLKYALDEKISVSTIVLTGTRLMVEVK